MTHKKQFRIELEINPLEILTEDKCAELLREIRWREGNKCPYCGSINVRKRGKYGAYFKYECLDCNRIFNDKTGTIFYKSHLPVRYWCAAMILNDLGYSILRISRMLNISYDSAYRLVNKLRTDNSSLLEEIKEKVQEMLEPILSEIEYSRKDMDNKEEYVSQEEIESIEISRDVVNFVLSLINSDLEKGD